MERRFASQRRYLAGSQRTVNNDKRDRPDFFAREIRLFGVQRLTCPNRSGKNILIVRIVSLDKKTGERALFVGMEPHMIMMKKVVRMIIIISSSAEERGSKKWGEIVGRSS
ncbi:hypothetical protein EN829_038500 [Mesorhizobium sp. M00.F.Ca.ET.186.01.1.1]|nr:hypothetical protein EN829_038500 [Mesorhizobium sp. M00.F.Ca.ET.186.01.1.1]